MNDAPGIPTTAANGECRLNRRGFTLIEIVLVLMVLSLSSLLILPEMQPLLERTRREAGLRRVAGFLNDVRTQAVAGGKTLIITHDEVNRRLVAREEGDEGREGDETGSLHSLDLPSAVETLIMNPERLRYFPPGHSSGTVLTFGDQGSREDRIAVGSFTGLARIEPDN